MADRDKPEAEGRFLERWSRRKAATTAESPPTAQAPAQAPAAGGESDPAAHEELIASLPDIESLDADSDFKVFLQEGVPDALKRRALRKLWRLNPVIASVDGLNDYDDDFTDAATVIEGMQTLFQAGKGMRSEEAEAVRREAAEAEAAAAAERAEQRAAEDKGGEQEQDAIAEVERVPEEEPDVSVQDGPESAPEPLEQRVEAGFGEAGAVAAPKAPRRSARARRWGIPEA